MSWAVVAAEEQEWAELLFVQADRPWQTLDRVVYCLHVLVFWLKAMFKFLSKAYQLHWSQYVGVFTCQS